MMRLHDTLFCFSGLLKQKIRKSFYLSSRQLKVRHDGAGYLRVRINKMVYNPFFCASSTKR